MTVGPNGTIPVCIFNGGFYKRPLCVGLNYNCSVVNNPYHTKRNKEQVYHISSIFKYYYANKTTFGEISKNIEGAVILLLSATRKFAGST